MQDAFTFIISALLDLYVVVLLLRLVLGLQRVDFRNPLAQAILKATNPLVLPARRLIPATGRLDTATLVVLLLVQVLGTGLLASIACLGPVLPGQLMVLGLLRLVWRLVEGLPEPVAAGAGWQEQLGKAIHLFLLVACATEQL